METMDLEARWGDRKESLDDCAERAFKCLSLIAISDKAFARWYLKAKSRRAALTTEFVPTLDSCRNLLAAGLNRYDPSQIGNPDLGYSLSLWNGGDDKSAVSLRFHCGAHPGVESMPTPNECRIQFPTLGSLGVRLLEETNLRTLLTAVVVSWDPDWGTVSTFRMHQAIHGEDYKCVSVGRITYLSDRYGPLPALPEGYDVVHISGHGNLIYSHPWYQGPTNDSNHLTSLRRLSERLKDAGLLSAVPPR